jgi:hypothetical protein
VRSQGWTFVEQEEEDGWKKEERPSEDREKVTISK